MKSPVLKQPLAYSKLYPANFSLMYSVFLQNSKGLAIFQLYLWTKIRCLHGVIMLTGFLRLCTLEQSTGAAQYAALTLTAKARELLMLKHLKAYYKLERILKQQGQSR